MNYVFTYIGEFGYELFQWQGNIRKWSKEHKQQGDKIFICSRKGLENIYEFADYYLDVSHIESFKNSIGGGTTSICTNCYENQNFVLKCCENGTYKIENDIKNYFKEKFPDIKEFKWILSSDKNTINNINFGTGHFLPKGFKNGIYNIHHNYLDLNNNHFIKLCNTESPRRIKEPYILCQTAWRTHVQRSKVKIEYSKILENLQTLGIKILLLDFDTGKKDDSFSKFDDDRFEIISCDNCNDQVSLIKYAKACVFFTEGDFRSHLYVPPFVGKDVIIISPQDILNRDQAPIEFWNTHVFKFGGQMLPIVYEDLISSQENINLFNRWVKEYLAN